MKIRVPSVYVFYISRIQMIYLAPDLKCGLCLDGLEIIQISVTLFMQLDKCFITSVTNL